jgi:C4-dicarboxylate-specific signal transduction histidine kinase
MPISHDMHERSATTGIRCTLAPEALADFVIETILRMTLASTGATSAQFLVSGNDGLRSHAKARMHDRVVVEIGTAVRHEPFVDVIAHSVLRSGESVTLETANEANRLFVLLNAPERLACSALFLPLFCGPDVVAVLYLEHDHVEKAFSGQKRELIELLTSQIAVTLESASRSRTELDKLRQSSDHSVIDTATHVDDLSQAARLATVGEIVASIVHEMSQPLSAIDASSGAALRWLQRDMPDLDEATISLEKVQTCSARAREIIERMRTLNRQASEPFESFDVHAVIREAIRRSRTQIEAAGATIALDGLETERPVFGSRMQIQQVVGNLIVNALEAMAQIDDRPRKLHIASACSDIVGTVISVADSGPGIPADSEDRIFRPFYTTKPQGLGMGLPICKRIVESHGGAIWVQPSEPHGVRFFFSLMPPEAGQHRHR